MLTPKVTNVLHHRWGMRFLLVKYCKSISLSGRCRMFLLVLIFLYGFFFVGGRFFARWPLIQKQLNTFLGLVIKSYIVMYSIFTKIILNI